jgi:hypothetical protein
MADENKPRIRVISLEEFEKQYAIQLEMEGLNDYTRGYQKAIKDIHKLLSDHSKTKELLSEVYEEGAKAERDYYPEDQEKFKEEFINRLII